MITEQSERNAESSNNIKSQIIDLIPYDMPNIFVAEMKKWKVISKSPFSNSFYDITNKSWSDDGNDNFKRISDHWNFKTSHDTKIHCKTDGPVNKGWWTLAIYDDSISTYKIKKTMPPKTSIENFPPGQIPNKSLWDDVEAINQSQFTKLLGGKDRRAELSALVKNGLFGIAKAGDIRLGIPCNAEAKKLASASESAETLILWRK